MIYFFGVCDFLLNIRLFVSINVSNIIQDDYKGLKVQRQAKINDESGK